MKPEQPKTKRLLYELRRLAVFFLLIAFVVTCCMVLFINTMVLTMDLTLTDESIGMAAKFTMGNVLILAIACTAIDSVRRRYMVEKPVHHIVAAAQKVIQGDFSVRIPPYHSADRMDGFDTIIDYFNRMVEELGSVETLRTDFISNVSHELKTPLAVIQNYGTMLQNPDLTEQERLEYARAITESSRRLASLITNILKLNRLENQQIFPEAREYDLSEQLCQSLLLFENVWEEKELEIDADIEDGVMICADPELLSLVWNNLISNAVKFTPPKGTLGIRLTASEKSVQVQISDTGCGISPETGAHIFEKFYQGDTSHATQGNGLGLALVKRIIDITQSSISVQSEPQKGSTFTVQISRRMEN